jgi:hypothetical protein
MYVILSEAKDLTVGMRICGNQLKINEAKMIQDSLRILPPMRGPALRSG